MTKKAILSIVSMCILGAGLLSCPKAPVKPVKFKKTATGSNTHTMPDKFEEAFDHIVQVLHAPYANADKFFMIFTDDTNVRKNGLASAKIGKGNHAGSGTWNVKAATDNSIVYEYKAYQPKGSDIKVTGKMSAMHRSKGFSNDDSVMFNQKASSKIQKSLKNDKKYADVNKAKAAYDTAAAKTVQALKAARIAKEIADAAATTADDVSTAQEAFNAAQADYNEAKATQTATRAAYDADAKHYYGNNLDSYSPSYRAYTDDINAAQSAPGATRLSIRDAQRTAYKNFTISVEDEPNKNPAMISLLAAYDVSEEASYNSHVAYENYFAANTALQDAHQARRAHTPANRAAKAALIKAKQADTAAADESANEAAALEATAKSAYMNMDTAKDIAKISAKGIGKHIDTIKIAGAYKARLNFIYEGHIDQGFGMSLEEYDSFLIQKLFVGTDAYITFTYGGKTRTLDTEQLAKLLHVLK